MVTQETNSEPGIWTQVRPFCSSVLNAPVYKAAPCSSSQWIPAASGEGRKQASLIPVEGEGVNDKVRTPAQPGPPCAQPLPGLWLWTMCFPSPSSGSSSVKWEWGFLFLPLTSNMCSLFQDRFFSSLAPVLQSRAVLTLTAWGQGQAYQLQTRSQDSLTLQAVGSQVMCYITRLQCQGVPQFPSLGLVIC